MCAAVPVALLLLVILAALSVLRLSKGSPNARLLCDLHNTVQQPSTTPSAEHRSAHARPGKAV